MPIHFLLAKVKDPDEGDVMGMEFQDQYDDGMFEFSQGNFTEAIQIFSAILEKSPQHLDAQMALSMAYYRQENYNQAIAEGLKAEALQPKEQLVHTNLSLFYMKAGDKQKAEHHGLQARIASWRDTGVTPPSAQEEADLKMAGSAPQPIKLPEKFPDMPWKKKPSQNS